MAGMSEGLPGFVLQRLRLTHSDLPETGQRTWWVMGRLIRGAKVAYNLAFSNACRLPRR